MKRIICLVLSALMLLFSLASCKKGDSEKETESFIEETTPETDYYDTVPSLDCGGADFKILVSTTMMPYYEQEETSGATINDAVFKRNEKVESVFNLNLVYTDMDGNRSGATQFATAIRAAANSGVENAFDIVIGQNYYTLSLATEGYYQDLMKSNYINWDSVYSHEYINKSGVINGKLYGASNDFVMSQINNAMITIFNKKIYSENGNTEDIYQLVRDKKWTWEKYYNLVTSFEDTGVNGSSDDIYGSHFANQSMNAMVVGLGTDFAQMQNEKWTFDNFYTEKLENIYEKLRSLYNNYNTISNSDREYQPASRGNILFYCSNIESIITNDYYKNHMSDFGFIPQPMLDEDQGEYRTYTMRFELFHVPVNVDFDRACIVADALGYETRNSVYPTYVETVLRLRAAQTTNDSEMIGIVIDSLYYDFAVYYYADLDEFFTAMTYAILRNDPSFSTEWASFRDILEIRVSQIYANYGGES